MQHKVDKENEPQGRQAKAFCRDGSVRCETILGVAGMGNKHDSTRQEAASSPLVEQIVRALLYQATL